MRLPAAAALPSKPPALPLPDSDWHTTDPWIRFGNLVIVGLCVGLMLFSLINISGAVVAQGTVSVEGNYKTIQHLDGGIVSKILVKNGDRVHAGHVLIRLDDTQVKASLAVTNAKLQDVQIQQARLETERDGQTKFQFPSTLSKLSANPQVSQIFEGQRAIFIARAQARRGEQSVLTQRYEQLLSELAGLELQLAARNKEVVLNKRELDGVLPLFERGFVNQQRLGPLQREQVRLEGEIGRLRGDVAKAKSGIAEAELKLAQSDKDFMNTVLDDLRKVQAQVREFEEQRLALQDKLNRIEIRAPRSGLVHALATTTEGGVITPASQIAQVIPDDEKFIIEAKLTPGDIDKVRGGQAAFVRFPSLDAKSTPRIEGLVTTVSPAQIADPQGRPYFTAQIELSAEELAKVAKEHQLVPGMSAEVYIETRARTMLSYMVKPLVDAVTPLFRN
jgi:HlyD family secretion protein